MDKASATALACSGDELVTSLRKTGTRNGSCRGVSSDDLALAVNLAPWGTISPAFIHPSANGLASLPLIFIESNSVAHNSPLC